MITDVMIIGAGPAGAVVGGQIASAGFNVLTAEKDHYPGKNKVCGGAVPKNVFEDLELPKKIIEKEVSKLAVHFPEERMDLCSEYGYIIFEREKLDQLLIQRAIENGAKLLTSALVFDVIRSEDKTVIQVKKLPGGEIVEIHARLVIFADGVNTLAYRKFGIGFETRPDWTALGAAYDLKWRENPVDSLEFFFSNEISPFGYGWIFPRKDSVNVGVECIVSKMQGKIRSYLDCLVNEHPEASEILRELEVIRYGARHIPASIPKKIHGDSMMVVGDAAGTADPLTGSGIENAIESGKVAAKVAVEALEANNLTEDVLTRYEDAWKETENYKRLEKSLMLQRIALKIGANPGIYLKQLGLFDR